MLGWKATYRILTVILASLSHVLDVIEAKLSIFTLNSLPSTSRDI
jgi:hypothetical protein